MTDTRAQEAAAKLTSAGRLALLEGCGCDVSDEMLALGLWEPEFPSEFRQEYFNLTSLGEEVRRILQEQEHAQ